MSQHSQPATGKQLTYLRALANLAGTTFITPRDRRQASREIERLRSLKRERGRHVEPASRTGRDITYATAPHSSEIEGWGASARWRTSKPRETSQPPAPHRGTSVLVTRRRARNPIPARALARAGADNCRGTASPTGSASDVEPTSPRRPASAATENPAVSAVAVAERAGLARRAATSRLATALRALVLESRSGAAARGVPCSPCSSGRRPRDLLGGGKVRGTLTRGSQ
jgi:hypothetical protein